MANFDSTAENSIKHEVPSSDDDDDDGGSENEDFYFESDHLALRGNSDYHAVLRTLVVLEAQRIEAAKHIDKIVQVSKRALQDPESFIKKLTSGEGLDVPQRINIQNLPKIKFEKYNVPVPSNNQSSNSNLDSNVNTPPNSTSASTSSSHPNATFMRPKEENDFTVRGRVFDQSKPETFNQLWTCEEQRRLEELLVEYPPEPVEMRRFAKIAKALGNRTPRQVASRLQKYFQKLHAAGLPVPGRIPRNARSYTSVRKNRMVKHMVRPTTFFPSNYVPVNITEDDDNNVDTLDPNYYRNGYYANNMNDDDVDNMMMVVDEPSDTETDAAASDTSKIAAIIKRVKRDKEAEHTIDTLTSEHNGYKCDYCDEDPIIGTRWHCVTCAERSADYCSDCFVTQAQEKEHHPFDHIFLGYRVNTDYRMHSDDDCDVDDGDGNGDQHLNDADIIDDISQFTNSPGDFSGDDKEILFKNNK